MAHSLSQGGVVSAPTDPMQAQVRILGTRLGRFVEFEFALYGGDLAVELILPTKAFEEFCQLRGASVCAVDQGTSEAIEQMAWRAGHPGLLQRTATGAAQDERA
ncbi:phenol hydroxylase subunit [Xanthobacter sp. AM11]|uniref:phenol hydroxylase subunit n=1 Tax=Xanthobacter sp. AM11 TaxID=3380643 RepID=UPI0039BF130F